MVFRLLFFCCLVPLLALTALHAQEGDGGATVTNDGGGETVLQSIAVAPIPGAPFSLTLGAEWARSMTNGGTFTTINARPIKRDSMGRIYQERVLMAPRGMKLPPKVSWIQIEDSVAHTYLECNTRTRICDLQQLITGSPQRYQPSLFKTGVLSGGKAYRLHEDLGVDDVLGVAVHRYRDTTTVAPGVMGNDKPMVTLREFSYAQSLGLNLRSVVDAPSIGRQTFTVTEITLTEPDPSWFAAPVGYQVRDVRELAPPVHD